LAPAEGEKSVEIDESREGNRIVLRPVGRLDNQTSAEFQARLLQTTGSGVADIIIDFTAVDYISSGGLRALTTALKQKPADHRIAVTGLHAIVQEIFAIAGFQQVLPIFATVEDAARAWADPSPPDGSEAGSAPE
jgi:anti-sigma B factor antagonist